MKLCFLPSHLCFLDLGYKFQDSRFVPWSQKDFNATHIFLKQIRSSWTFRWLFYQPNAYLAENIYTGTYRTYFPKFHTFVSISIKMQWIIETPPFLCHIYQCKSKSSFAFTMLLNIHHRHQINKCRHSQNCFSPGFCNIWFIVCSRHLLFNEIMFI